ncbi:protocadherin Fat 4 [Lingula anatina]|uniref:Protocadherin Fat 4 n=1 Tax=Lingula anatina TaxID=7574 RepID=A0A2R2MMW1_LINAN|nr:protocadherin Fat 4 [Lingula anatina]|eukprot:XP_023931546.1 protocadherin Fat 4 [Lingula anatina]
MRRTRCRYCCFPALLAVLPFLLGLVCPVNGQDSVNRRDSINDTASGNSTSDNLDNYRNLGQLLFCVQFFSNIWTKAPVVVSAYDNTLAGGVLFQFEPSPSNRTRVQFSRGDIDKIVFDPTTLTLRAQVNQRPFRGEKLTLYGQCEDYVEILALPISLDVSIEVTVGDGNDPPVFRNLPATIEIDEDVSPGTQIYIVNADDPFDVYQENTILHFSVVGIEADGEYENRTVFTISDDGRIDLEEELDYDAGAREYKLNVFVEDEGFPIQFNDSTLTIRVKDVDDLGPKFLETDYYAEVIGEKPIQWTSEIDNKTIVSDREDCFETTPRIYAVDQDEAKSRPIKYRIIDGRPGTANYWEAFFRLNEDDGRLCQKQAIPRSIDENGQPRFVNFTFTIQAYQGEEEDMTDTATLHVVVLDINQNVPSFKQIIYDVQIEESPVAKAGDIVVQVEAEDNDFGTNAVFEYQLMNNPDGAFGIDPNSGEITILKPEFIDREKLASITLTVKAQETESAERFDSDPDATVNIAILDVNDNTPQFDRNSYSYTIKDKHEVGAAVQQEGDNIVITDPDTDHFSETKLAISDLTRDPGPAEDIDLTRFNIDENGYIRLTTGLKELRRQKIFPTYSMNVVVTDSPHDASVRRTASVPVTVTVEETNDYPPVFGPPKTVTVPEGSFIGTLIAQTTATDKDGDEDVFLTYDIISGNEDGIFEISNSYTAETTVTVIIKDVNDNPPQFRQDQYTFHIPEESSPGTFVGEVAAFDVDKGSNGDIEYRLVPGFGSDVFDIDQNGRITVKKQSELLDREVNKMFGIVVGAKDMADVPRESYASVEIILDDINDNAPKLSASFYTGEVTEDDVTPIPDQEVILSLPLGFTDSDLVDADKVRYSLSGPGSDIFAIDPKTGRITVKKPGAIDSEKTKEYNLRVTVTDSSGKTDSSPLKITVKDVNDNAPKFTQSKYTFDLDTVVPPGTVVGQIFAVDPDGDGKTQLVYILKGGGGGKFEVDPNTGEITVVTPLDKDVIKNQYNLTVDVFDNGVPRKKDTATVTINVPINQAPYFRKPEYTFHVRENEPINTFVGQVVAVDPESAPSDVLPNLGGISLRFESKGETEDDELVTIDEPLAKARGDITVPNAVRYGIIEPGVPFRIDVNNGEIFTLQSLDRESVAGFEFTVTATDRGTPSKTATAKVTVLVDDSNDNAPVFSQSSYEGFIMEDNMKPKPGQMVRLSQPIMATDKDEEPAYKTVRYSLTGPDSDMFSIDPVTGMVAVSGSGVGQFDREGKASYEFQVVASDQGSPSQSSTARLKISLDDENDNAPVFQQDAMPVFEVGKDVKAGNMIGSVTALDRDATAPNNEVMYLLDSDAFGKFKVEMKTGKFVQNSRELLGDKFDVSPGTQIYIVNADDPFDVYQENTILHFSVVGIEADGEYENRTVFTISDDGRIDLEEELDYDAGAREYKLNVFVEDEGFPIQFNDSTLTIRVKDVDDLGPKFLETDYYAEVIGEKPIQWTSEIDNKTIVSDREDCFETTPRIYAVDQDEAKSRPIKYRIIDGRPGTANYWEAFFRLNEDDGRLCQKQAIPRSIDENGQPRFVNFTFTIQAYQGEEEDMTDTATLHVVVLDINQNVPSFKQIIYDVQIEESPVAKAGDIVVQVEAEDNDFGTNAVFEYQLMNNPDGAFGIDPNSGEITILKPEFIDREKLASITLTVKAQETESAERFDSDPDATVNIAILDVNDNTPQFDRNSYSYTIKDKHEVGAAVQQEGDNIVITDPDTDHFSETKLAISDLTREPGPAEDIDLTRFNIDENGYIRLTTGLKELRRQKIFPTYSMNVVVTDSPHDASVRRTASVPVTVTVEETNDYPPVFGPPKTVTVPEGSFIGTLIAQTTATDRDGDEDVFLTYDIISGNEDGIFEISNSGWITSAKELDREEKDQHLLQIRVTDGKYTAETTVTVIIKDINDNPPKFRQDQYTFHIPEESSPGTFVGEVAAFDVDKGSNGDIEYRLVPGFGSDVFDIDQNGRITVKKQSELLDREINKMFGIVVGAKDMADVPRESYASVEIILDDINDNAPKLSASFYTGEVTEDDVTPIPDQEVILSLPLGFTDSDLVDADKVRYSLSGPGSDIFAIDPKTGRITVKKPGAIDSEKTKEYNLRVTVTDSSGKTDSSPLKITVKDVNDNAPKFTQSKYTFDLDTVVPPGTVVGQIFAVDPDGDGKTQLVYILKGGGGGKFEVDPNTGEITVVTPLDKDVIKNQYNLTVDVFDNGVPRKKDTATVTINVPINQAPYFRQPEYTFHARENEPINTFVGQVVAVDPESAPSDVLPNLGGISLRFESKGETEDDELVTIDEPLAKARGDITVPNAVRYGIIEPGVPFRIDVNNGEIFTLQSFDRESVAGFEFTVTATDRGTPPKTATAKVTVLVDDSNDNAPVFSQSSYEGFIMEDNMKPKPGQMVRLSQPIVATDKDEEPAYKTVRYSLTGPDSDMFSIDPVTGMVAVSGSGVGQFDREGKASYEFQVVASDQGSPSQSSTASLKISLDDENDNAPVFQQDAMPVFEVGKDVKAGNMIGSVTALDRDATAPNNEVMYLLDSDAFGKFKVEMKTGEIKALEGVYYPPTKDTYMLKIKAMDMGYPTLEGQTDVMVKIDPSLTKPIPLGEGGRPYFVGDLIFYTPEEQTVGSVIGTIQAKDSLGPGGKKVPVYIAQKDKDILPFKLDPTTGQIIVTGTMDRDMGLKYYAFEVHAVGNTVPPVNATAQAAIILSDINDNPPRFTHDEYRHVVHYSTPPWSILSTPFAYDKIDELESAYDYRLFGKPEGVVIIDPQKGNIIATDKLITQPHGRTLEYTIRATDLYNNELKAEAKLKLTISGMGAGGKGNNCGCCLVRCGSGGKGPAPPQRPAPRKSYSPYAARKSGYYRYYYKK